MCSSHEQAIPVHRRFQLHAQYAVSLEAHPSGSDGQGSVALNVPEDDRRNPTPSGRVRRFVSEDSEEARAWRDSRDKAEAADERGKKRPREAKPADHAPANGSRQTKAQRQGASQEGKSERKEASDPTGQWSTAEDKKLLESIDKIGEGADSLWNRVSQLMGKSPGACKKRSRHLFRNGIG